MNFLFYSAFAILFNSCFSRVIQQNHYYETWNIEKKVHKLKRKPSIWRIELIYIIFEKNKPVISNAGKDDDEIIKSSNPLVPKRSWVNRYWWYEFAK